MSAISRMENFFLWGWREFSRVPEKNITARSGSSSREFSRVENYSPLGGWGNNG